MRKFKDFFETRNFVKNLNTTFIVMVPKKGRAEEFKDYRPISLVGSLYKLIAKVLGNRLKRVMHSLINEAQNAFVEGRQIMDASLLTNEVIDTNWVKILIKMGFGAKWVNWVKRSISTASFSVLVNGSLAGFFNSSRGLRHGDPLSPYLFIIDMEVFSILMDKAASGGFPVRLKNRKQVG